MTMVSQRQNSQAFGQVTRRFISYHQCTLGTRALIDSLGVEIKKDKREREKKRLWISSFILTMTIETTMTAFQIPPPHLLRFFSLARLWHPGYGNGIRTLLRVARLDDIRQMFRLFNLKKNYLGFSQGKTTFTDFKTYS